jgi:small subunit ribosomal protein S4
MIIGPRYKKARYLGASLFKKTQTDKYAARAQRKAKNVGGRGGKSEYGKQMLEKQKARYSYGVSSGQFGKYVKKSLESSGNSSSLLIQKLEGRLDNVVFRSGFCLSRSQARQMVSHGHLLVNGKRVTIPSLEVKVGDIITVRKGSENKKIFENIAENVKNSIIPAWIKVDIDTKTIKIDGIPSRQESELLFDMGQVLEFYTR